MMLHAICMQMKLRVIRANDVVPAAQMMLYLWLSFTIKARLAELTEK